MSLVKQKQDDNQSSNTKSDNIEPSCDNNCPANSQSTDDNSRIIELEHQLKRQSLLHKKELEDKTSKISALEESILTSRNVNKLQNTCKSLYQDGDEIAVTRIDDISSRAARRSINHHAR